MASIFVTGALGAIGTFLVPYLRKQGHHVIASDILIRDYVDYIRADITSFEDLYRVFKNEQIDTVIHMAARVGRMLGEERPQKMIYVNNVGTLNLIKLGLEHNCQLINFSTSEVYGHLFDQGKPVKEDDLENTSPFTTTNIYAMTKLFAENLVKHYVENYGLKAITVRPFMVYMPNEYPSKYRSAMINFVHHAIMGETITVHKGAVRAWCYVSDFIQGLLLAMQQPIAHGKYEAYNIGSDEYHTMEELAHIIIDECGSDYSQIQIVEPPKRFSSLVKRFSVDKLKALGYKPKVSVRQGIRKVVGYQKKEMEKHESLLN